MLEDGFDGIQKQVEQEAKAKVKGGEILLNELNTLIEGYKQLEKQLKKFEKKHGRDIAESEEYSRKVAELREELGLPPEIGVYHWEESPSFSGKLTGKGKYYNQLAMDLLRIGQEHVKGMGGIIALSTLMVKLAEYRPGRPVPIEDVLRTLERLEKNGIIGGSRVLSSGTKLVEFMTTELTDDQSVVLSFASRTGSVSLDQLITSTGWTLDRVQRVLDSMEESGMAIKETHAVEGIKYYFPSL